MHKSKVNNLLVTKTPYLNVLHTKTTDMTIYCANTPIEMIATNIVFKHIGNRAIIQTGVGKAPILI